MKPFIAKRYEPVVQSLLLTLLMTFIVSGISTVLAVGIGSTGFAGLWFTAWMSSWAVAFPALLLVGPVVGRILRRTVHPD